MKRRGRKSKSLSKDTNGVDDAQDENGQTSDREDPGLEEPEEKKKRGRKRKSDLPKNAEGEQEEESQYEVEAILDEKNIRGVKHYLIRWKGYEPESDTWEPESTLNCAELITEFKAKHKKKNKSKPKSVSNNEEEQDEWDENEDFEVDRIIDVYFKKNGKREFLVSWKGYPPSQNSWEPEENMDCKGLIEKFMAKVEKAKNSEQKELRVKRAHTDRFTLSMDQKGRRLSKRNQGKQRIHYHETE